MSSELHILKDLLAGQSTVDSLAPRVGLSPVKTIGILTTLKREGLVTSEMLAGIKDLHVYRLTSQGKASLVS